MGEDMRNSPVRSILRSILLHLPRAVAVIFLVSLLTPVQTLAAVDQPTFATPEAAMAALLDALERKDADAVLALFGKEHRDFIIGGDPAGARKGFADLAIAAKQATVFRPDGEDRRIIEVGRLAYPLPIPLVRENGAWRFDTEAGMEEITNRRIGANELHAIRLAHDYVDAQVEYASKDRDGDQVLEYAQKFASTAGRKDGLYWQASTGSDDISPFGPLIAEANQDYLAAHKAGEPYYGYYYKILTRQGANPPGGAYDYVINGNMIAGFALIAWPADYGVSGIMTFVVSHQGAVFQKDLGPDTAALAAATQEYDPDDTWTEVQE
jgi:enoyl-CoA hydratase/carnithine racemase